MPTTPSNPLPLTPRSPIALLLLLLVATVIVPAKVHGHPGAVADGRATCGSEYSTPETAYTIPDIREAWYIRRVATCTQPAFWTRFDITKEQNDDGQGQKVYIAVISPQIDRFEDDLQFHGIWYGPGLTTDADNGLADVPNDDELPPGITNQAESLGGLGAGYLTSPATFDSCDFVDTSPVMDKWSDVIDGRCMEEFPFGEDFTDALQQDSTVYSWWLYSFNHRAVEPGTYYLQTWLTSRDDTTKTAQGKYEITLGPWSWGGYASDSTLSLAQSQGTSCACAVNAWDYREDYLERLGELPVEFEIAQLPGGSCAVTAGTDADSTEPSSPCETIPQEQYMTDGSSVEWSGLFNLQPDRTYEWTFRAYYQGTNATAAGEPYGYPDPGMFVLLVPADDVGSVSTVANDILTRVVEEEEDDPTTIVAEGETLEINTPTFIEFTDPLDAVSTTVLITPTSDEDAEVTVAVFTQHVPSEFMAHALRDAESGEYVFPTTPTLYVDKTAPAEPVVATDDNPPAREEDVDPDNCAAEGGRSQSCGATNPDRPPTCCVGLVCAEGAGVRCVAGPPTATSAPTGAPVDAVDVAATTPAPTPDETSQPTADGAGTTETPTAGSTEMVTDMTTDNGDDGADAPPPGVRDDPSILGDDATTSSAFAIASMTELILAVFIASAAVPVLLL